MSKLIPWALLCIMMSLQGCVPTETIARPSVPVTPSTPEVDETPAQVIVFTQTVCVQGADGTLVPANEGINNNPSKALKRTFPCGESLEGQANQWLAAHPAQVTETRLIPDPHPGTHKSQADRLVLTYR